MRRNAAYMKVPDYHVFGQVDHEVGDGRPRDQHEILLLALDAIVTDNMPQTS